jgi:uroporphyrinogen-III synthase
VNGATVGITATRRSVEQAALIVAMGGIPRHGPSVDIDRPAGAPALARIVDEMVSMPPDVAVFMTGVGARHLLCAARDTGAFRAVTRVLDRARVIARGGKPRRVLREFGIRVDETAVPAEGRAVRDGLLVGGVTGLRILVQCAGADPDPMSAALRAAGAAVHEVHPYSIDRPRDARAALMLARSMAAARLDAITFTSANAVHGFAALAERAGVDVTDAAAAGTIVAAVGPVTRRALLEHGMAVHVEPATPRMGAMYHDLAAALGARGREQPARRVSA